jgi:polar amino acid transport system substrate-binding protein
MQSFVRLLQNKNLCLDDLITHELDFSQAADAYQMILDKSEPFVGIVLKYDTGKKIERTVQLKNRSCLPEEARVGFIGAGSFAQNFLLPEVSKLVQMVGVATARGNSARNIAGKYNFEYATGDVDDILKDKNINTVFIATRHNTHAGFVVEALRNGKNVFVEKPLAMNPADLEDIRTTYQNTSFNGSSGPPRLMVGFNRRFAPHIRHLKELWSDDSAKAINYRINAGAIPPDHWVNDPEVGGGRIIGEVCHFVDLCMYLAGSKITSLSAQAMPSPPGLMDTISVNLGFDNGSVASIAYFSNGNKSVNKENIEVFCAKQVAVIDDFREMTLYGSRKRKYKLAAQDKGYGEELRCFIESIKAGEASPIAFEDLYLSTLTTMKIIDSIKNRETVLM